jgi:hypothetical protein
MIRFFTLFTISLMTSVSYGQCLDPQAHNTSADAMWLSCEARMNPLQGIGETHWILYEFDEPQSIGEIHVWNVNHPDYLLSGAKRVRIDISSDGAVWSNMGTYVLDQADGSQDYVGQDMEGIEPFEAQFIIMTILESHGGPCSGLAEVQFVLDNLTTATDDQLLAQSVEIIPNPVDLQINVGIVDVRTSEIVFQLVDMTGKVVDQGVQNSSGSDHQFALDAQTLPDGQYALQLVTDEGSITKKIIVIHPK